MSDDSEMSGGTRNALLIVSVALVLLMLFGAVCQAQPVVRLKQTVQRCGPLGVCRQVQQSWTGCLVGTLRDGRYIVATCAHEIETKLDTETPVNVEIEPDVWVRGEYACWHKDRDVAAIAIRVDKSLPCVPLGTRAPAAGVKVEIYGSPKGGRVWKRVPFVRGRTRLNGKTDVLTVSTIFEFGESGGPVIANDMLVGVVLGHDGREGFCPPVESLRTLLTDCLGELPVCGQSPARSEPEPLVEAPDTTTDVRLAAILLRLDALERSAGKPGPPGKDGRDGAPGKDADQTVIAALEARIKELENRQIPVELLDQDGNVKQSVKVRLGEPIRLKLIPRTQSKE